MSHLPPASTLEPKKEASCPLRRAGPREYLRFKQCAVPSVNIKLAVVSSNIINIKLRFLDRFKDIYHDDCSNSDVAFLVATRKASPRAQKCGESSHVGALQILIFETSNMMKRLVCSETSASKKCPRGGRLDDPQCRTAPPHGISSCRTANLSLLLLLLLLFFF